MCDSQHSLMSDLKKSSSTGGYLKIYIQRDYSEGTSVKFQNKFPVELEGKIEKSNFEETINGLNTIYEEAERINCETFCEGCFACITGYFSLLCAETHYEKCLRKAKHFIQVQNETVWMPRGLHLTDPVLLGLRAIEITVFSEAAPARM